MTRELIKQFLPNVSLDGSPITQPQQIEILQDTSQSSLEQYIRTQYSSQPTRFGKLLLMLSSLRKIEPTVIEQLFFADVLRGASMGDVLKKMLTSNSTAPIVHGSLMAWEAPYNQSVDLFKEKFEYWASEIISRHEISLLPVWSLSFLWFGLSSNQNDHWWQAVIAINVGWGRGLKNRSSMLTLTKYWSKMIGRTRWCNSKKLFT